MQDICFRLDGSRSARRLVLLHAQVRRSGICSILNLSRKAQARCPDPVCLRSVLHRFKAVYSVVHARHHELGSNVTAFGTAFGEALDYGLCICLFHLLVYVYLRHSTAWNPVALAAFFFAEVQTLHLTPAVSGRDANSERPMPLGCRFAPTSQVTVVTKVRSMTLITM